MMKVLVSLLLSVAIGFAQMAGVFQQAFAWSMPDQSESQQIADTLELLEVIRGDEPFFASDFGDDGDPWRIQEDDEVVLSYQDGTYHIDVTAADSGDFASAGLSVADFYVEFDATQIAGPPNGWFGLLFRNEADDFGYVFSINGDGAYQVLWMEEDQEPVDVIEATLSPDLNTGLGTTNRLGLLARGPLLTLLANDIVLAEVEHEGAAAGDVGLVAFTQEDPGLEVAFDNLQVWDLTESSVAEPEPTATPVADDVPDVVGLPVDPLFDADEFLQLIRSEEPLFEDTFQRDRGRWPTGRADGIDRSYADRRYHVDVTGVDQPALTTAGLEMDDFLVEVLAAQIQTSPGSYVGLLFRYVDAANFYAFLVNRQGEFLLQKWLDGEPQSLIGWQDSDLIDDDEAENLLGVAVSGPTILLLANDVPLAYLSDETFAAGDLGLVAGTMMGDRVESAFDDLVVWDVSPGSELLDLLPGPVPATEEVVPPEFDPAVLEIIYAQEPLISESFTRDRGNWDTATTASADRYYRDRSYYFHVLQPASVSWTSAQLSLTDFFAEVTTKFVAGPLEGEAGLLFRFVDGDNFYRFAGTGNGEYRVDRLVSGVWAPIVAPTVSPALASGQGASNRIGVLARGSTIVLMANDEVLAIVEDDALAEGDLAFMAGTYVEPGVIVAFDDLEIWDLAPLADQLPRAEAAPRPRPGVTTEPAEEGTPEREAAPVPIEEGTPEPQITPEPAPEAVEPSSVPATIEETRGREPTFAFDLADVDEHDDVFQHLSNLYGDDWWDYFDYSYVEAAYHVTVWDPGAMGATLTEIWTNDFYMEMDTKLVFGDLSSTIYGVMFRWDGDWWEGTGYLFGIDGTGGYQLMDEYLDGVTDYREAEAIASGEGRTNRLGLLAKGSTIVLLANDSVLAEVQDDRYLEGYIGLFVFSSWSAEESTEVAFSNLKIWELE